MLLFDWKCWKLIDAEACKDGWVSLAHHGNGNENEWLKGLAKLLGPNQHGNVHLHAWCGGLENQNVWVISLISEENDFRFQLQDLWWTSLVFPASSIFYPALVFTQWAQGLSQLCFRPSQFCLKYVILPWGYDGSPGHPGHGILAEPSNFIDVECDMTFVGLVGILDPPRPECKPAIEVGKNV